MVADDKTNTSNSPVLDVFSAVKHGFGNTADLIVYEVSPQCLVVKIEDDRCVLPN